MSQAKFPNFDIKAFLDDHDIHYRVRDADDHEEVQINCTQCVDRGENRADVKMRLWIAAAKGTFYCYNCGWDGNLIHFVMKMAKVGVRGALRIMRGRANSLDYLNNTLSHDNERIESEEISELPEVVFPYGFEAFDEVRRHTIYHDYLKKRGIPLSYAKRMGWGFSTVGWAKGRLVVPTYMNDRLVFWQGRDVLEDGSLTGKAHPDWDTDDYRKVLNPKGVSSRKVLYGYDCLKEAEEVVLVEGFVDAAKVGYNAVAINGKVLHSAQVEALASLPRLQRVIILLDEDAWTDQRIHRSGPRRGKVKKPSSIEVAKGMLKIYFDVTAVRLPDQRDPGKYRIGELDDIIWPVERRSSENFASM